MERFKLNIYRALGCVYIPNKLSNSNEKKILHISDTPLNFFSTLSKLIKNIEPDYIIHTGDLVDNIKLGLNPNRLDEYEKGVKSLLTIMENSSAQAVYITLGNHDSKKIVTAQAQKSIIIEKSAIVMLEQMQLKMSHYATEILKKPANYNLFGHDVILNSNIEKGKIFLNGIQNINIITTESKKIFTLPYPIGTNDSRLGKFKIGI